MPRFKYKIEMVYMPASDTTKHTDIPNECIRKLYIDHNYKDHNMATMYCILNIDKNLYDTIILGAKTDSILLTIYKIDVEATTETKLVVYNNVCEYFLADDINYNKDIDYQEKTGTNGVRKDIHREANIGLMFKECIERNKSTVNAIFVKSSMNNIIISELSTHPLLLEPLTYNDTFDQLIVPPKDSAVKCLDFLNDVKVFYDTQYRFFIEPDCSYLVSSSGAATQKKSDKYDTIKMVVYPPADKNGNALGQSEDDKSGMYLVNVSASDTTLLVNSNLAKQFSSVKAIINPSKDNSLSALSSVQSVINDISQIAGGITGVVSNVLGDLQGIPSSMSNISIDLTKSNEKTPALQSSAVGAINKAITLIQAMPEPSATPTTGGSTSGSGTTTTPKEATLSAEDKAKVIKALNVCIQDIKDDTKSYNGIVGDYKKSMSNVMGLMGNITNTPSFLSGVSPVNAMSNMSSLTKCMDDIKTGTANETTRCSTVLHPYIDVANGLSAACDTALGLIAGTNIEEDKVKDINTTLNDCKNSYLTIAKDTSIDIGTHSGIPIQFTNIQSGFEPYVNKMKNVKVNLAAQFTNLTEDMTTLGNSAKSMLTTISTAGKDAASVLKKTGLSMKSLVALKDDINAVKDISSIGKLGMSSFNFNLNLGRSNGTGALLYKVRNDNPNKAKNIKFEMENNLNTITISKNDLDTSIFNINMKYIIKNFDTHSDKDGAFILDRKIEMFAREDDKFMCNLHMQFRLVPSADKGTTKADAAKAKDDKTKKDDKSSNSDQIVNVASKIASALSNPTVAKLVSNNSTMAALARGAQTYEKSQNSDAAKQARSMTELMKATTIH